MSKKRYVSIDIIKGIAVIGMVIFHLFFILYMLSIVSVDFSNTNTVLKTIGRASALIFLFLSGFNLQLNADKKAIEKYLKRIAILSFYAALITVFTVLFLPTAPIYFGILHFFAVVSLLLIPLLFLNISFKKYFFSLVFFNLFIFILYQQLGDAWYFIPFGYYPKNFVSVDYYPIFPWIYVVLFGTWLARVSKRDEILSYLEKHTPKQLKIISVIGKYSLQIYMIHAPIIIFLAFIYTFFSHL